MPVKEVEATLDHIWVSKDIRDECNAILATRIKKSLASWVDGSIVKFCTILNVTLAEKSRPSMTVTDLQRPVSKLLRYCRKNNRLKFNACETTQDTFRSIDPKFFFSARNISPSHVQYRS